MRQFQPSLKVVPGRGQMLYALLILLYYTQQTLRSTMPCPKRAQNSLLVFIKSLIRDGTRPQLHAFASAKRLISTATLTRAPASPIIERDGAVRGFYARSRTSNYVSRSSNRHEGDAGVQHLHPNAPNRGDNLTEHGTQTHRMSGNSSTHNLQGGYRLGNQSAPRINALRGQSAPRSRTRAREPLWDGRNLQGNARQSRTRPYNPDVQNKRFRERRNDRRSDTKGPLDDLPMTRESWQTQKKSLSMKFPEGWAPRKKLSPDALEGIRELHATDPITFDTPTLANRFEVSPEAIRRILKSKWRPNEEEEDDRKRRWEKRGQNIWSHMSDIGLRPPRKSRRGQQIADTSRNRVPSAVRENVLVEVDDEVRRGYVPLANRIL